MFDADGLRSVRHTVAVNSNGAGKKEPLAEARG